MTVEAATLEATPEHTATSVAVRWYVLLVMCLVYTVSIADRYVISTVLEPIRLELQLTDSGVAFLTGVSLSLFYVSFGIPIAVLADRTNRRNIIAISLLAWSAMTALCREVASVTSKDPDFDGRKMIKFGTEMTYRFFSWLAVSGRAAGKSLTLTVKDSGSGICREDRARIFKRFYRGRNVPTSGSGLGLPIAKRIVESHGGRIDVRSEVGAGTDVDVSLPTNGRRTGRGRRGAGASTA